MPLEVGLALPTKLGIVFFACKGDWYMVCDFFVFLSFLGELSLPSLPTRLGLSTRREQSIEDLHGRRDASTQMEMQESKPSSKCAVNALSGMGANFWLIFVLSCVLA